jgi:hypothetical protein
VSGSHGAVTGFPCNARSPELPWNRGDLAVYECEKRRGHDGLHEALGGDVTWPDPLSADEAKAVLEVICSPHAEWRDWLGDAPRQIEAAREKLRWLADGPSS